MEATIKHNPVWEYKKGAVIKEEVDFITVRLQDSGNKKLWYDIRFPRSMVELSMPIAQA